MDTFIADLARHLRVADKDIKSVKDHEYGYDVLLADGCHILVAPHGDYSLNGRKDTRRLPLWKPEPKPKVEITGVPDPEIVKATLEKFCVPMGSPDGVLNWVNENKDRAEAALKQERERPKPRLALIKQLERIVIVGD